MNADNYPDVSFINGETAESILSDMISDFQEMYEAETGKTYALAKGNPWRLILEASALQIYQAMMYVDFAGKMSLLSYTYGDYLDNVVAIKGTARKQAEPAVTVIRFSIDEALGSAVAIPAGCRVTNGNDIYFATDEYAEIAAGSTYVDVKATCTEAGTKGNGFVAGEFNVMVNTVPYVTSANNISETYGGADVENDDELKNRFYNLGKGNSTAGPIDAYVYHTKEALRGVGDVRVSSPSEGGVKVVFMKNDGTLPSADEIQEVSDALSNKKVRPLTDHVTVAAPNTTTYNINLTYYISDTDSAIVGTIQNSVAEAVDEYNKWQQAKIGRDINPDQLKMLIIQAGAKRVNITSPAYTVVADDTLPQKGTVTVTYGGIESE